MTADTDFQKIVLTDDPDAQNDAFLRAFNSGSGAIFDQLYRDDAISNLSGRPLNGPERTQAIKELLATGPSLDSRIKYSYRAGDVIFVVVDFDLELVDEAGERVKIHGTCTDVLRQMPDGTWLMAIDRPVGDPPSV
ncbi:nuclear transport factor 2 family protein [Streptomyces sp. TRM 70351]|uniref:YybH family protein n=1 Tax=Streptomyces sp. TRM 70351 TaxID=3116552 RepID=UPI002E7B710C|nr:nuclear transport factor 2 family protein [Streptomyces sp. TRM 70351]MEE1929760.1 nuclear transport factor 2 family protein [Streptomyces sp. TRM 70351]